MSVRSAAVIERAPPAEPVPRTGRGETPTRPDRVNPVERAGGVHVQISDAGRQALARSRVASVTLAAIEDELGVEPGAMEETEREAYLEQLRESQEAREATSERAADGILGGILGYVYDAFQLENPDAGSEELERFREGVSQGLDRGLRDAMDLMRAFSARQDEVRALREESLERVRAGLEGFVEKESATLLAEQEPDTAR